MNSYNGLFRKSVHFITIISIILFMTISSGCSILRPDRDRKAHRKEVVAQRKEEAQYNKVKKQHYKNQSKDARKRMKQTKKQAASNNKGMERHGFGKTNCKGL